MPACAPTLPSVVVLTWNDGPMLDAALASIPADEAAEVIVVDNGSDVPPRVPAGVDLIRLPDNQGVAAGRNVGAGAAAGDVVCFLDSDAELRPGSLRRLTEVLLAGDGVGLVAPVFEGQPAEASAGGTPTLPRKAARGLNLTSRYASMRRTSELSWDVEFAIGACQVFRRAAFDAVGGLDGSIFYGPEDVDFCLRLRRAGYRILQVEDAPVWHPPRRRNRRLFTRRGAAHATAVARQLRRQRRTA